MSNLIYIHDENISPNFPSKHSRIKHSRTFSIISGDNFDDVLLSKPKHAKTKSIKNLLISKNLKHIDIEEINKEFEEVEFKADDSLDNLPILTSEKKIKNEKDVFIQNLITPKINKNEDLINLKSSVNLINKLNETQSYRYVLDSLYDYNDNAIQDRLNCTIIEEETEELITNSAFSIKKKSMFYGPSSTKKSSSPIYIDSGKKQVIRRLGSVANNIKIQEQKVKESIDIKKKTVLEHFNNKSKDFSSNNYFKMNSESLILNNLVIEHPSNMTLSNKSKNMITNSSTISNSNRKILKITKEVDIFLDKKPIQKRKLSSGYSKLYDLSKNPLTNIANTNKPKVIKVIKNNKLPLFTVQNMRLIPDK